jgi:cysteinyl-tRNA synthetase
MHANMLTLNGQKMSKSTGNNILPDEILSSGSPLLAKTFSGSAVKFFMLQAHYRSVLDLSSDALVASEKGFHKIIDAINKLENLKNFSEQTTFDIKKWSENCYDAMNDDFNTPILIANIFEVVRFINKVNDGKAELSKKGSQELLQFINSFVFEIMGLEKSDLSIKQNNKLDKVMNIILELRNDARIRKDFSTSDKIRDLLKENGISINDNDNHSSYTID